MPIRIKNPKRLNIEEIFKKREAEYVTAKKAEIVQALSDATPVDSGEAQRGWIATETGIENPVPHINSLNRGSSQQAPSHFIERTLLAIEGVRLEGDAVKKK
jgi:hypothetical protein